MTTLEDIKKHMLDYMSSFNETFDNKIVAPDSDDYYDDDGHCGKKMWDQIKSYWQYDFNTNADFEFVVSGEWISDDLDLEGGRDYILSCSNIISLFFDYMINTLKWSKSDFEDVIYNSLSFNEELGWMFDEKNGIVVRTDILGNRTWNDLLEGELVSPPLMVGQKPENGDIFIPKYIKYHNNMKNRLDNIDALKFISTSLIDNNYSIYELTSFGCTIPKGEIIYDTNYYGF